MVSLEKNRVFTVSQIQSLGTIGSQLLETGHEARIEWIECLGELASISSKVPSEIRRSALTEAVEQATEEVYRQGSECIDFYEIAGTVRRTAIKLCEVIPACDITATKVLDSASDIIDISLSILEELKSYIDIARTNIDTAEYVDELYKYVSDNWETFTDIQDTTASAKTILKGLPSYTEYHGDPVNMSTGNFLYSYQDLAVQGKHPMVFSRFYNALDTNKGTLGRGWIHNWETRILTGPEGITLIHPDGREEPFEKGDENSYRSSQSGQGEILKTEDGFYLRTKEENILLFDESGRLTHLVNESGSVITLAYKENQLVRVQADTGEYFRLEYNDRDLLAKISDHSGRSVLFSYNKKKLETVTDPLGQIMHFYYGKNGRIDRITDKRDICILQNEYDDNRRITRQEFPDGGILTIRYMDERNRVYLTEQNGNQIVYVHDGCFRNIKTDYEDGSEMFDYDDQNHCISYTDKRRNTTHYEYNAQGCLTAVTDALSYKRTADYDEAGRILMETGPDGSRTCYAYDESGRLVQITDPLGNTQCFLYEGKGNFPKTIRLPDGGEMKLAYDHRGNISSMRYPDGRVMKYRYDSLGRVAEYQDGNGNRTTFTYDNLDRITSVTRSDGKERTYEYNPMGEAVKVVDFDGFTARWDYNVLNKPERYTDKEGRVTLTEYDKVWQPVKITDPEGGETCYTYDHLKRITAVADPTGRTVRFAYDPNGNLIQIRYPDDSSICYEYDALNRKITETNVNGGVTRFFYDGMGRIIKTVNPAGGETCYQYDSAGNKLWEKDAAGAVTAYTYTSIGKIESVTLPSGRVERYHYLPGGKLVRKEARDGTWEAYDYDAAGNLLTVDRQNGTRTEYVYDCMGRIIQVNLDGAVQKRYAYDALGNVTVVEDALGNQTRYRYSPEGNLTGVTDPEGNRAIYLYNGRNELTGILRLSAQEAESCTFLPPGEDAEIPDKELWEAMTKNTQGDPLHLTLFDRDSSGRPQTVTNALGQKESYQYDCMGRIASRTDRAGETSTFSYYPDGKPKSASYPDGRSVFLSYDALGNLERVKDWLGEICLIRDHAGRVTEASDHRGETFHYEWNPDGSRKRMEYPDGLASEYSYDGIGRLSAVICGDFRISCRYDENGRLAEVLRGNGVNSLYCYDRAGLPSTLTHTRGAEILEQLSYGYDRLGNPVSVERKSTEEGCSYTCGYGYDQNGRLSTVRMDGSLIREYHYDGYGNRISATAPGVPDLPIRPYTPLDQPAGSCYTPNGGLTGTADGYGFRYDTLGRLKEITCGGELLQGNEYDGLGHRVHTWGQISGAFSGDIRYTVDYTDEFGHILMEQGERERKYLWQQNTLYGMPEEICYVLTDALNTPIQVTDGSGRTQNAYRYDEFGVPEYRREESPLPFGFTGYLTDRAGGLYYANAREYHAGSGRFLTKDLNSYMDLKDPNTLNLYQYVKGNPLKYVDYSGHESINEDYGYLFRTANMAVSGSLTNDFTVAGLGIQLGLGFINADFPCDVRDFVADVTVNKDVLSPKWWGTMVVDVIAFFPVIGELKYLDELAYGIKMLFKDGYELLAGGRQILKAADSLGYLKAGGIALNGIPIGLKGLKNADVLNNAKYVDDFADAASDVGKRLDDLADVASDAGKKLDDLAGGGGKLKIEEVVPSGSTHPVKVYTDGNAQINTGKIDTYIRGKVELDVEATTNRIDELKNIKKSNPEDFTKEMKKELQECENQLHNYQRSQEMSKTLNEAGIEDTIENNQMIIENLYDAAKEVTEGNTEIISYIDGVNGKVQIVSRWKILSDGSPYLATIILKPVK